MNATAAETYGVQQTNGLENGHSYHSAVDHSEDYSLKDVRDAGGRITRVRILTGTWPGMGRMADISYIHATLPATAETPERTVPVRVGVELGVPLRELKKRFIDWAKEEGVYAKGLGLLDESNWSILY